MSATRLPASRRWSTSTTRRAARSGSWCRRPSSRIRRASRWPRPRASLSCATQTRPRSEGGKMTTAPKFDQLKVGDTLPPLKLAPISRHQLALYCGGSGDHNPIHVDIDFAKKFGFKDVFAHGMLSMAFLGRLVTSWVPQTRSEEHTSELQSRRDLVCRLLLEKKKN